MNKAVPNLSASSAKTLQSCSWLFQCQYIHKLPERVWAKTKIGTLTHIILECLANERRKPYYEQILKTATIEHIPSLVRLRDNFYHKNPDITPEIAESLDSLVWTALQNDFYHEGATKVLPPEMKFQLTFPKFSMKGFMDSVAFFPDKVRIRDYKTQSKKFTEKELEDNIQAAIYQLAIKQMFNMPAEVEFVMLRFPPTSKQPDKHIQRVEPYGDAKLDGLKHYLEYLFDEFRSFDDVKAKSNLKAFHDKGFCDFVCSYKKPFDFYSLVFPDGKFVNSKEKPLIVPENAILLQDKYNGCPFFYGEDGRPRNWK